MKILLQQKAADLNNFPDDKDRPERTRSKMVNLSFIFFIKILRPAPGIRQEGK